MSDLCELSLAELSREIGQGRVSPLEATEACLQRIEARDGVLNSFLSVCAEAAREEARGLTEELAAGGRRGPLHGVPLAMKDLFETRGLTTTAGSRILGEWVPDRDATAVRFLRNAGMVLLGKLNMHEFAFGTTTENEHYGPVRNPHDPERIAGGSSGGSAAAVAGGLCYGSLGSDTGGSIRCPAAVCGIVGLKPTYGRVSRTGVVPLAWSLDHVGPMTRTVEDAALLLEGIAGHDPADSTSVRRTVPAYTRELEAGVRGLRLGVPREYFWEALPPEVETVVRAGIERLRAGGAEIREVSLPWMDLASAAQAVILRAEATAYHSRWLRTRSDEYGPKIRLRLLEGVFLTATDYLDAQRARRFVRRELLRVLAGVDALLTPAVPVPAPRIGEPQMTAGGVTAPPAYFMVRNTALFNLTGLPALSVPCGRVEGLPVGLQIAGRPWEEALLLRVGQALER